MIVFLTKINTSPIFKLSIGRCLVSFKVIFIKQKSKFYLKNWSTFTQIYLPKTGQLLASSIRLATLAIFPFLLRVSDIHFNKLFPAPKKLTNQIFNWFQTGIRWLASFEIKIFKQKNNFKSLNSRFLEKRTILINSKITKRISARAIEKRKIWLPNPIIIFLFRYSTWIGIILPLNSFSQF